MKKAKATNSKIKSSPENETAKVPGIKGALKGKSKNTSQDTIDNIPEKPIETPIEKPNNLERFIYVTTYSDSDFMGKLKSVFEEINPPAFNLQSVKEIYTHDGTEEEQSNNEIDYISGCQGIDKEIRITILEGITGKGIKTVKERGPKYQMNTGKYKVFSDERVGFNKRVFAKFGLSLKFIKLRETLQTILTTYDIYSKANRYRDIYNTFLNYGSIMQRETMQEIADENLFPDADSLSHLELKYADMGTEEDLTGIRSVKKKKKRIRIENIEDDNLTGRSLCEMQNKNSRSTNNLLGQKESIKKGENNIVIIDNTRARVVNKSAVNSHNNAYIEAKKHMKKSMSIPEMMLNNKKYIITMKRKANPTGKFCRSVPETRGDEADINVCSSVKNNYYLHGIDNMRERIRKDKSHYYTYSMKGLGMSFPMLPVRNEEYHDYVENKKKWSQRVDFQKWAQPKREFIYFPKIK